MDSMIKQVFQIVAILTVSLFLWGFIMGAAGRTSMWRAIEPAIQQHWSESTMKDGKIVSDTFSDVFDNAPSYQVNSK